jgi:serine O-acetyltransferase
MTATMLECSKSHTISTVTPDWSREQCGRWWDPSRKLLQAIRRYQRWKDRGVFGKSLCYLFVLQHRFWSVVTGADIPLNSHLGGGLLLPHPNGVVIHPDVQLGPNCLLFQQVTLGTGGKVEGVPRIGGHVDIGAGAKVLGGVTIGANARIGANAVVLCDVPANATAVGVPASVLHRANSEEQS